MATMNTSIDFKIDRTGCVVLDDEALDELVTNGEPLAGGLTTDPGINNYCINDGSCNFTSNGDCRNTGCGQSSGDGMSNVNCVNGNG